VRAKELFAGAELRFWNTGKCFFNVLAAAFPGDLVAGVASGL
jgi:hypothetical protein